MASKTPTGCQPPKEKSLIEEADTLNCVIAKLSVLGDFFKHAGDDSFFPGADTSLGLYLIMGECIDTLKMMIR